MKIKARFEKDAFVLKNIEIDEEALKKLAESMIAVPVKLEDGSVIGEVVAASFEDGGITFVADVEDGVMKRMRGAEP